MTWFLTHSSCYSYAGYLPRDPFDLFLGVAAERGRTTPHYPGVSCAWPSWWRSLHPIDGFLAPELFLRDVCHCLRDPTFYIGVCNKKQLYTWVYADVGILKYRLSLKKVTTFFGKKN
jgi:hypothetical protein